MRKPELKERSSRASAFIFRVEEEQFLYPEHLGNRFLWIAGTVPIYQIPRRHIQEGHRLINAVFFFLQTLLPLNATHTHTPSHMCHCIFDTFPRLRRTNRHFDAFVHKILQSALTPFWSGQICAPTSLTKGRNSRGRVTANSLKPLSVSNLLFSREIFCSGTLHQILGWQCEKAIRWAWCEKLERCSEKRICWDI